jgi:hypothetical protein
MESVVELEINVGQAKVAELFADPRNNPLWMDDIERVESITGELGQPGSKYRLVPKRGPFTFIATVALRDLPNQLGLTLDASSVSVAVQATLVRLSDSRTKLVSTETFRFKGLLGKALGLFSGHAIRAAHRHHMEGFKRFAESTQ